jgi:hypothetical protein
MLFDYHSLKSFVTMANINKEVAFAFASNFSSLCSYMLCFCLYSMCPKYSGLTVHYGASKMTTVNVRKMFSMGLYLDNWTVKRMITRYDSTRPFDYEIFSRWFGHSVLIVLIYNRDFIFFHISKGSIDNNENVYIM